jgi:hypothetical protein
MPIYLQNDRQVKQLKRNLQGKGKRPKNTDPLEEIKRSLRIIFKKELCRYDSKLGRVIIDELSETLARRAVSEIQAEGFYK